ncbi:MAG: hypothetical protein L6R40_005536 [Gallowayella cf. fulva]|nr:MAG: hypothetical protein L6R40_005536 [Xanthomendoza cf. fulva]
MSYDSTRTTITAIGQPHAEFLKDLDNFQPLGSLTLPLTPDSKLSDDWEEDYPEHLPSHDLCLYQNARNVHAAIWRLLCLGWLRTFTRRYPRNRHQLQVRIYLLPADVGGKYIERNSRDWDNVRKLIACLDLSKEAWEGTRDIHDRNSPDIASRPFNHDSLFYLFNTLPSPAPSSHVACPFSSGAIDSLLNKSMGLLGLRTELYDYQKRSAAMMIRREAEPIQALDPRLEEMECPAGGVSFYDRTTGILFRQPRYYDEARGGILAETMGQGKSLICLAAIVATKGHWPQIPPEFSLNQHRKRSQVGSLLQMAAAAANREQIPWRSYLQLMSSGNEDLANCRRALEQTVTTYTIPPPEVRRGRREAYVPPDKTIRLCAATLVVVPRNLVSHWKSEIAAHVVEETLQILELDSNEVVTPLADDLMSYDLILMSKDRLVEEMCLKSSLKNACSCSSTHRCRCSANRDYSSPLKELHFLRIIVDEGHNFSTFGRKNSAVAALACLRVERRWIVSGTPSSGLLGVEASTATLETLGDVDGNHSRLIRAVLEDRRSGGFDDITTASVRRSALQQERKDLEKLGSIVVDFLNLKPWSNSKGNDAASWKQYIMPTESGQRKPKSLGSVLESLVIRHRVEDIEKDIELPPLHNRTVYLEPRWHDKLCLNLFILNLAVNAVTSERIDQDYMFNSRNRASLNQLITNLRYSGFYWTGFRKEEIVQSIDVSRRYLKNKYESGESEEESGNLRKGDFDFLQRAIRMGETVLASPSWIAFSAAHELGLYVEDFPEDARKAWSLPEDQPLAPLIIGTPQLSEAQHHVDTHLYAPNPASGLTAFGETTMAKLWQKVQAKSSQPATTIPCNSHINSPILPQQSRQKVGGALLSTSIQKPMAMGKRTVSRTKPSTSPQNSEKQASSNVPAQQPTRPADERIPTNKPPVLKSALKSALKSRPIEPIDPSSVLSKTRLSGTASAKLSYLLDRVVSIHDTEKIIIFYEGGNIAFYIAETLELLGIRYLIYTGTLSAIRKSAYITTFNTTETFRILLMDVRQAAHGLHIAAASRVFFVNPVWQPTVEAQAIKRAHRIGQTKPVFVETLVLKDTLEDRMLQRRKNMSAQEHHKAEKSLLDDDVMEQLIKNADFIPLLEEEMEDVRRQMAPLKEAQKIFGRVIASTQAEDPDGDLVFPEGAKGLKEGKRKWKGYPDDETGEGGSAKKKAFVGS